MKEENTRKGMIVNYTRDVYVEYALIPSDKDLFVTRPSKLYLKHLDQLLFEEK